MPSYVYVITHTDTGRVYVGKTNAPRRRWMSHLSIARLGPMHRSFRYVHAAIQKYGPDRFTFSVVGEFEIEEDALAEETRRIQGGRTYMRGNGFNIDPVTVGGGRRSPETGAKISAAKLGKKLSPEAVENIRAASRLGTDRGKAWLGRKHSAETKLKISAAQAGQVRGPCSDQVKNKIAAALRGRKAKAYTPANMPGRIVSDETRARISASQLGKKRGPQSPEHIEKRTGWRRGCPNPSASVNMKRIWAERKAAMAAATLAE